MVLCFTGHRVLPRAETPTLVALLDRVLEELFSAGYTEFRTGGARGFDTLAALRVLALKKKHPECRLALYLPCRTQADGWNAGERALYRQILDASDEVHCPNETYFNGCMQQRNRALVDGADLCLSFLRHGRGGTYYTCAYALSKGVALRNLAEEL